MVNKKMAVLISGIAGSGKSTIARYLSLIGLEAYGIEDMNGMFKACRKDTGELFKDYDPSNMDHVQNMMWGCDVDLLKGLIENQKNEIAFYAGVTFDMDEIIPLFDKFILLSASPEVLHRRLCTRAERQYGGTEEVRQKVLQVKDDFEQRMRKKGAIVVNADGDLDAISKGIIEVIS
jgi:dephospho-CoA kinase